MDAGTGSLPRGVYGVVRSDNASEAVKIASAWLMAGVPAVEVTMTVPDAAAVIEAVAPVSREANSMLGAGTVLTADDVDRCVDAGAQFIVSPVTQVGVITRAVQLGVPVVAGVLTPSEIWSAHLLGAAGLKVFPVNAVGGARYASSVLEPMPGLCLIASGGVPVAEVQDYLDAGFHAVALGSGDLADHRTLAADDVEAMRRFTKRVLARFSGTALGVASPARPERLISPAHRL
jgi:2-dehydro-3-deoxyphosphogluconate aldolase/(4S)-4-hydroxy-2-oxoglutarate aldolase